MAFFKNIFSFFIVCGYLAVSASAMDEAENEGLPSALKFFPSELFLPSENVEVKNAKNFPGTGIIAKKAFAKGEKIFTSFAVPWLEEFPDDVQFFLNGKKFTHNREIHTYIVGESFAIYSGWNCFMNHSCDPNTGGFDYVYPSETEEKFSFTAVALKSIAPGDELTCDYNTFEWDIPSKQQIEKCLCGSDVCLSKDNLPIKGMKYLPLRLQKQKFSLAIPPIQEQLKEQNPSAFLTVNASKL